MQEPSLSVQILPKKIVFKKNNHNQGLDSFKFIGHIWSALKVDGLQRYRKKLYDNKSANKEGQKKRKQLEADSRSSLRGHPDCWDLQGTHNYKRKKPEKRDHMRAVNRESA